MIFWFKEIKKHNVPILISLLIGIIFLLSQVLPMFAIGDSFDGVQFLYQDDDYLYLAHIKDIVDGHFKSSSPVFFEYKDAVPVMFPFVYYFYALPTLLLGIPLLVTILLSKAFLPAVAFFLAYYLSLKMMSGVDIFYKKISAVATGLLVVFAYDIVNPINLISIFSSFGENFYQSPLLRLVNPVSGLVLLLTSFILLWHFHKKDYKKNYKKIIATASLFFVMSGYIFSYAISLTALVLLILLSVYKKHFTKVRGLIFIFIVAILPFLYQFMISLNSEDGNSSALKMGLFYTHEILFNTFLIVFVILFITSSSYLAISRKYKNLYKDKSWQFLAIIFLS